LKIPTIKPTTRMLVIFSIIAGLLFIVTILAYTVGVRRLGAATAQLQEKQKQVENSTRIAKHLVDAQQAYLKVQGELGFLETSVSTYAYVPTLLGQLEELGKKHNLKVISVRPQMEQKSSQASMKRSSEESADGSSSGSGTKKETKEIPKPYDEMKVEIQLEGTYWCMHDFMLSLTRFPKIIAVKALHLSPSKEVERLVSPELQAKLTLTAFIFKDSAGKENVNPKPTPPVTNNATAIGRSNYEG